MSGGEKAERFEVTRREVNLSLLATAFAAAARLPGVPAASVHLFDFAIAGAFYYGLPAVLSDLRPGAGLTLVREPQNPHGTNAVAVYAEEGIKLGYIPRRANTPIGQLLDAGQVVHAEIKEMLPLGRYLDLPKDLVFTSVASGDPVIRLTTSQSKNAGTRI